MCRKPPSAQEAAAFGLTLEEASGPPVEVYPDNVVSVNVFVSVMTQWRGNGGGLDYGVLPFVLKVRGVPEDEWLQVLDDVRIMESVVMNKMGQRDGR